MGNTINEVQKEILDSVEVSNDLPILELLTEDEQLTLGSITSESKVSAWREIIYIVSVSISKLRKLFELFKIDIKERMAVYREFSIPWYKQISLDYQHGQELLLNNTYDNEGLSLEEIKNKKIIAKVAVVETELQSIIYLRFKIARMIDGILQPTTVEQLEGFKAYMKKKSYAGSKLKYTTLIADQLKVHYKLYFDPSVLNIYGARLDGTNNTPVPSALNSFLTAKNINDFNGELSLDQLNDIMELVPGITDVFKQNVWSKFGIYNYESTNPQGNVGIVEEFREPESGYFELDLENSVFEFYPRIIR